jgi:hypothetical protein
MTVRIDVENLHVYDGEFLAVEGAMITVASLAVTAFIRPFQKRLNL